MRKQGYKRCQHPEDAVGSPPLRAVPGPMKPSVTGINWFAASMKGNTQGVQFNSPISTGKFDLEILQIEHTDWQRHET